MFENKITIDGKDYVMSELSDAARAELTSMQLVDSKIAESQQELAILQTARNAYCRVLKEQLANVVDDSTVQ